MGENGVDPKIRVPEWKQSNVQAELSLLSDFGRFHKIGEVREIPLVNITPHFHFQFIFFIHLGNEDAKQRERGFGDRRNCPQPIPNWGRSRKCMVHFFSKSKALDDRADLFLGLWRIRTLIERSETACDLMRGDIGGTSRAHFKECLGTSDAFKFFGNNEPAGWVDRRR